MDIKELLLSDHIFNISKIEKTGMRKLKLHEFVRGKAKLTPDEALKIKELLKSATKLQK
jgi:plasmid maintenance system antidote protein VapI